MTTDTQTDADATTAQPGADAVVPDTVADAETEALKVLAKARYEAFRLVTDARDEADSILEEARKSAESIIHTAEITAESITDAARIQAKEIVAARPQAAVETPIENTHPRSIDDQVAELREIAQRIDARFTTLTQTEAPPSPPVEPARGVEPPPAVETPEASTSEVSAAVEPHVAEELVEEPVKDAFIDPAEDARRGSFYSRRSAKLPSIGDAAGKGALDMMRSIRESFDDGD